MGVLPPVGVTPLGDGGLAGRAEATSIPTCWCSGVLRLPGRASGNHPQKLRNDNPLMKQIVLAGACF